jgi:hypothetical protein
LQWVVEQPLLMRLPWRTRSERRWHIPDNVPRRRPQSICQFLQVASRHQHQRTTRRAARWILIRGLRGNWAEGAKRSALNGLCYAARTGGPKRTPSNNREKRNRRLLTGSWHQEAVLRVDCAGAAASSQRLFINTLYKKKRRGAFISAQAISARWRCR